MNLKGQQNLGLMKSICILSSTIFIGLFQQRNCSSVSIKNNIQQYLLF
jgi:hypothetical protein